jgi:hypothetical protein
MLEKDFGNEVWKDRAKKIVTKKQVIEPYNISILYDFATSLAGALGHNDIDKIWKGKGLTNKKFEKDKNKFDSDVSKYLVKLLKTKLEESLPPEKELLVMREEEMKTFLDSEQKKVKVKKEDDEPKKKEAEKHKKKLKISDIEKFEEYLLRDLYYFTDDIYEYDNIMEKLNNSIIIFFSNFDIDGGIYDQMSEFISSVGFKQEIEIIKNKRNEFIKTNQPEEILDINPIFRYFTPMTKAGIEISIRDVRNISGHQEINLIDIMSNSEVKDYFVELVALNIGRSTVMRPSSYAQLNRADQYSYKIQLLLIKFKNIKYSYLPGTYNKEQLIMEDTYNENLYNERNYRINNSKQLFGSLSQYTPF